MKSSIVLTFPKFLQTLSISLLAIRKRSCRLSLMAQRLIATRNVSPGLVNGIKLVVNEILQIIDRTYLLDLPTDGVARTIFVNNLFPWPERKRKLVSLVIRTHVSRVAPDLDLRWTCYQLSYSTTAKMWLSFPNEHLKKLRRLQEPSWLPGPGGQGARYRN